MSVQEREILKPVVEAGNAAAHRGWAPSKEQITVILDTVEGLIHRLLVLPTLAEELNEAVPARDNSKKMAQAKPITSVQAKIESAPKDLRKVFDALDQLLMAQGSDVTKHPQKHYMAYRRNRNFASVQIYNQKRIVRIYLNLDPDWIDVSGSNIRDVRQIGHFGTGDLEVTIKSKEDIDKIKNLITESYLYS